MERILVLDVMVKEIEIEIEIEAMVEVVAAGTDEVEVADMVETEEAEIVTELAEGIDKSRPKKEVVVDVIVIVTVFVVVLL